MELEPEIKVTLKGLIWLYIGIDDRPLTLNYKNKAVFHPDSEITPVRFIEHIKLISELEHPVNLLVSRRLDEIWDKRKGRFSPTLQMKNDFEISNNYLTIKEVNRHFSGQAENLKEYIKQLNEQGYLVLNIKEDIIRKNITWDELLECYSVSLFPPDQDDVRLRIPENCSFFGFLKLLRTYLKPLYMLPQYRLTQDQVRLKYELEIAKIGRPILIGSCRNEVNKEFVPVRVKDENNDIRVA